MKKPVDIYDQMNHIHRMLKKGILITARKEEKINPMAISWGQIGIEWNRLIFTTYVRTGRFTHHLLEETGEFTVNIPMSEPAGKIIGFCGTRSGRDVDKVKELGLILEEGRKVKAPGIKELPLTLECRVIYRQRQDPGAMPAHFKDEFYPRHVPGTNPSANQDYHTMFFGEIVDCYLIE
jgi:flavin reductase (DIM6/NTAB) family NADH-FMN oxidoreductase RutF